MRTTRTTFAAMLVAGIALAAAYPIRANGSADPTVESIRKELLRLPYYGVFDFMSFKVENGQVTLMAACSCSGLLIARPTGLWRE